MLFWTIPQVFFLKLKPRMFFFVLYDRYSGLVEPLSPTTLYTLYYDHHQPPCTSLVMIVTNHLVYPLLWSSTATLYTLCYDRHQPPGTPFVTNVTNHLVHPLLLYDRHQPPCIPFVIIITNHLVRPLLWL